MCNEILAGEKREQGRFTVRIDVWDNQGGGSVNISVNGNIKEPYYRDVMDIARRMRDDVKYILISPEEEAEKLAKEAEESIAAATDTEENHG